MSQENVQPVRQQDHAMLSTFDDDGRVIRQQDFLDHAEALEAAGLRE